MDVRKWRRENNSFSFFTQTPEEYFGFDPPRAISRGDQEKDKKRGVQGERKEEGKKGEEDSGDGFFYTRTAEEFRRRDLRRVVNGETQGRETARSANLLDLFLAEKVGREERKAMEGRKGRPEFKSFSLFSKTPGELFGCDLVRAINGGDQEKEVKEGVQGERKEGKKGEEDGDDGFFFTQRSEFLGRDPPQVARRCRIPGNRS